MLTGVIASRNERHSANFKELTGAGKGMTALSILYLVGGLALAGIPPLNGFMSKIALVRGGADVHSWAILGIVIGGGLLTLLYVTRTWQLIFVKPAVEEHPPASHKGDSYLAPALLIAACIGLGIFAAPLVSVAEETAAQVANPAAYTCAVLAPSIQAGVPLPEGAYNCAAIAAAAAEPEPAQAVASAALGQTER
jgi:formate hydrogenlyase subunit 3/multisubunit Na+/H+ antiporter MnhD subunit